VTTVPTGGQGPAPSQRISCARLESRRETRLWYGHGVWGMRLRLSRSPEGPARQRTRASRVEIRASSRRRKLSRRRHRSANGSRELKQGKTAGWVNGEFERRYGHALAIMGSEGFVVWVGGVRIKDRDDMPKLHGKKKDVGRNRHRQGPLVMHRGAIGKGHLHGTGPGLLLERATVGWCNGSRLASGRGMVEGAGVWAA
jgi:hypothetical protein